VTGNLSEKDDPAYLLIEAATPQEKAAGLHQDCLICGTLLSLLTEDHLQEKIGELTPELLTKLDNCLKAALGLG
jgi:hypothetical protein